MVERLLWEQEVVGSNPAAPTCSREQPFDDRVKGLSHCGDESYAIERAVQAQDFEQTPLRGVIRRKPVLPKGLREFKHLHDQFGALVVRAVHHVELQLDRREPVTKLGVLGGEDVLFDPAVETEIQQAVHLSHQERLLALEFAPLGQRLLLGVVGVGDDHVADPEAGLVVLDPHGVEDRQHLPIDLGLDHTDAGMARCGVPGAAVVDVGLDAGLGLLELPLSGHRAAAMATPHELAPVGRLVGAVDVPAQERLHAVPGAAFDERFLSARVPLPLEGNLSDVRPVPEDVVDLAPREPRHVGQVSTLNRHPLRALNHHPLNL